MSWVNSGTESRSGVTAAPLMRHLLGRVVWWKGFAVATPSSPEGKAGGHTARNMYPLDGPPSNGVACCGAQIRPAPAALRHARLPAAQRAGSSSAVRTSNNSGKKVSSSACLRKATPELPPVPRR
jgi:hypothetical protein